MFLTNHTLTGIVLGLNIGNPALLGAAAFASHIGQDSLPHFGHPRINISEGTGLKLAIMDGLISASVLALALTKFNDQWGLILVGAFFACLPDLLYIPRFFYGWVPSKAWARFHKWIQWGERPWGIFIEIVWLVAMIVLISR